MISSTLENIIEEKRASLSVGSSGFISFNLLKTFFPLSSVSDVLMQEPYSPQSVEQCAKSVEPYTKSVEPCAKSVKPYAESVKLYAESVDPYAKSVKPYAESVKPYARSVEPYAGSVDPSVKSQRLNNGTSGTTNDYTYDVNGNMLTDRNKGITSISYNYLNLPQFIIFANGNSIEYFYNAAGQKVKKMVVDETTTPVTHKMVEYFDGFQYAGEILQFFPHAEGYVSVTPSAASIGSPPTSYFYNYIFNYTDHLGNVRLSYTKDPATSLLKVLEENQYYPFGLKHSVYNSGKMDFEVASEQGIPPVLNYVTKTKYDYKYNGKEFQDELGLGLYDYGWRNYDASIGRFFNLDRLSEAYYSINPYQYTANNPVKFLDVNREYIWIHDDKNKGTRYQYNEGKLYAKNEETGEYDVEYTAEEGSYVSEIKGFLNQIGCEDCENGKALLGFFSGEGKDIRIGANTRKDEYNRKNYASGSSVLTFFGQNDEIRTTKNYERLNKNFFATLAHEIGHVKSYYLYDSEITEAEWYKQEVEGVLKTITKDEVYATYIENLIREENGLNRRTHYGSLSSGVANPESEVLRQGVNGTWIMNQDASKILKEIINSVKK